LDKIDRILDDSGNLDRDPPLYDPNAIRQTGMRQTGKPANRHTTKFDIVKSTMFWKFSKRQTKQLFQQDGQLGVHEVSVFFCPCLFQTWGLEG
jgi:hypothetical protein